MQWCADVELRLCDELPARWWRPLDTLPWVPKPDLAQIDRSDIVAARSHLFFGREEAAVLKIRELLLRYMHASAVGDTDRPIAAL
ncbi:hypothetical protein [Paraburkholderia phenoliruptrix]|uniref:hypothetical protein n=1 Tax=Paraburkholderia phenoliruptrix TaxID=252970 RepID=UPI0034CD62C4